VNVPVNLVVNGAPVHGEVEARTTLLDFVRDELGLTGTHGGCEQGACGACSVLVDGRVVRACLMLVASASGTEVTTIEAVGSVGALHPLQDALLRHHGLQCGFCTPGVVMTALELLAGGTVPSEVEVRTALSGNLCRCTGYSGMVEAVLEVARAGGSGG